MLDSSVGSSLRETGAGSLAAISVWVMFSDIILLGEASIRVAGVCDPVVTGVGSVPVTCLFQVLCLLPVRALKTLVINP